MPAVCAGDAVVEVGFLGTGRMGKAMAANLLKAGHHVRAWDKATEPLSELERAGAEIAANAADAMRGDAIISMLPNDAALREVFIAGDLLRHGRAAIVSVNMGTVSLDCVDELVLEPQRRGGGDVVLQRLQILDRGLTGNELTGERLSCLLVLRGLLRVSGGLRLVHEDQ